MSSSIESDSELQSFSSKRSWVWSYFKKLSKNKAVCDICRVLISRSSSSTSGMRNHLKRHEIYEKDAPPVEKIDFNQITCKSVTHSGQRSWVWNYFRVVSKERAICSICQKIIKKKASSTSAMRNHLRLCHSIIEDLDTAENALATSKPVIKIYQSLHINLFCLQRNHTQLKIVTFVTILSRTFKIN